MTKTTLVSVCFLSIKKPRCLKTYIWLPGCRCLVSNPDPQTCWKTWTIVSILYLSQYFLLYERPGHLPQCCLSLPPGKLSHEPPCCACSGPPDHIFRHKLEVIKLSSENNTRLSAHCWQVGGPELPKSQSWRNCLILLLPPCTAGSGCTPALPATMQTIAGRQNIF